MTEEDRIRQEINKAGREMDALVAEIMGWQLITHFGGGVVAPGWLGYWDGEWARWIMRPDDDDDSESALWRPTEDIRQAFSVLEWLHNTGDYCCISLKNDHHYVWNMTWVYANDADHKEHELGVSYESIERAICEAALEMAKGIRLE